MDFRKPEASALSGPEAWVSKNLPTCPLCKKVSGWETATSLVLTVKRHYFRCTNCRAVLSVLATELIGAPGPVAIAVSPITLLVRIESAGKKEALGHLAGTEQPLAELQLWARETHRRLPL